MSKNLAPAFACGFGAHILPIFLRKWTPHTSALSFPLFFCPRDGTGNSVRPSTAFLMAQGFAFANRLSSVSESGPSGIQVLDLAQVTVTAKTDPFKAKTWLFNPPITAGHAFLKVNICCTAALCLFHLWIWLLIGEYDCRLQRSIKS
ncbi:hypothetical protein BJ138DRAFT_1146881 [Hygrophoropsis aurantiaca]|uniref:Uncharacterized protein n=1 Tax=Hygrophoropsis aurantiaca TaxID=72124 RepID=A0ACB8AHT9_9AGAM|nr:hypothetical protein BJ138DRAFT_1146881 [Hygrophoropsis aurantiaca]